MANLCVGSHWPNPVRGRPGGAGFRCKSGRTGKFIPNRHCGGEKKCPSSTGVRYRGGQYTIPKKYVKYHPARKMRRQRLKY